MPRNHVQHQKGLSDGAFGSIVSIRRTPQGGLFRRLGGRSAAVSSLIGDDLAQVFDALFGESGHAVLADTVDPKATVFWEHVDRQIEEAPSICAAEVEVIRAA